MQVERIGAPLGAVVSGIDVREVSDVTWAKLNELFCQYHVLVFPQQELTPKQQIAFASRWGTLVAHPYAAMPDYPNIIELQNQGKRRDVNQHWHSDMTYNVRPPKLTMLYAHEVPQLGGATAFANQILAYQELSAGMQRMVDGLQAMHSAEGLAQLYGESREQAERALHPVVRTHDETGRRALYVCRSFTQRFDDWSRQESRSVLEYLFEHSVRPEFQTRHQWRPGDLAMWDNRCLLHYAVHDHADERRVIHRLQVEGDEPR
jgi:taurine dioxygenase